MLLLYGMAQIFFIFCVISFKIYTRNLMRKYKGGGLMNDKKIFSKNLLLIIFIIMILSLLIYKYLTTNDLLVVVNDPSDLYLNTETIVYFGRESCKSCVAAESFLIPLLKDYDMKILYFDTDTWRSHEIFQKVLNDFEITSVPSIAKISNGKLIYSFSLISPEGNVDTIHIKTFFDSYFF